MEAIRFLLFSIRGDGLLYEVLNDDLELIGTLTKANFVELLNKH